MSQFIMYFNYLLGGLRPGFSLIVIASFTHTRTSYQHLSFLAVGLCRGVSL